jgi:molecular chaperone GrpE
MMYEQKPEHEIGEAQDSEKGSEVIEVEEVASLKQALAEETQKAEANLAGWQRAQADFINYKRRSEQEKADIGQYAKGELMLKLLPVLDDLERALAAIPPRQAKLGWVEGVPLIERKLRATLEAEGLEPIKALGEPFDPRFHEAVMQGKGKEGIVVEEIQKGYKLQDRVIRPSRVVVGSGEEGKGGEE